MHNMHINNMHSHQIRHFSIDFSVNSGWMQLLIHPSQFGCYPVALQQKSQASASQGEHELMIQILRQYLKF